MHKQKAKAKTTTVARPGFIEEAPSATTVDAKAMRMGPSDPDQFLGGRRQAENGSLWIETKAVFLEDFLGSTNKDPLFVESAFLRTKSNSPKKNGLRFINDSLVAVVPKSDPLALKKEIRIEDLSGKDLVMLEKGSFVYNVGEEACHKAGFDMKALYSDKHISNIADFVTKGLGIALLMEGHTLLIRNPMIRTIPIVPQIDGDIQICWSKNSSLTPAARSFLAVVDGFIKNEGWKPDLSKPLFPPNGFEL